ncbi:hypothetical protein [Methylobacterium sp. A54F]
MAPRTARRRRLGLLVLLGLAAARPAAAVEVPQVYLVQNSGWMEPFLTDPASRFRPLVAALVAATGAGSGRVVLAAFNQRGQVPGRSSPQVLHDGPYESGRIAAALAGLDLPRKPGGAFADADLNGALLAAVGEVLGGRDGVVWMVTNNRNAPSNGPEVARNTRAFAASLRGSPGLTRVLAWPVRMAVRGPNFAEGGFLVYGIGHGRAGGAALEALSAEGSPLRALFAQPPVLLKPPGGALPLRVESVAGPPGLEAGSEGGVLVIRVPRGPDTLTLRLRARLRNALYPQRIRAAGLAADWRGADGEAAVAAAVAPDRLAGIAPEAESDPFEIALTLPPLPAEPALTGSRRLDGLLSLRLTGLDLELDPAFLERVRPVFGGGLLAEGRPAEGRGALPELLLDQSRLGEARAALPVRIEISASPWPLVGLGLGGLALLVAGGAGAAYAALPRPLTVMLGPYPRRIALRPLGAVTLRAPDGGAWRVRRGLGRTAEATRLPPRETAG